MGRAKQTWDREMILCDAIMVACQGTCHCVIVAPCQYKFVQTHRIYNIKSDP